MIKYAFRVNDDIPEKGKFIGRGYLFVDDPANAKMFKSEAFSERHFPLTYRFMRFNDKYGPLYRSQVEIVKLDVIATVLDNSDSI